MRFLSWLVLVSSAVAIGSASATAAGGRVTLSVEFDTPEAVRGGETGLIVWAEVERGWHIQANTPSEEYLVPTEVKLSLPPGVSADPLRYPRPDRQAFGFAPGKELLVYEGKVGMTTALAVPADFAERQVRIGVSIRYQACNDKTCSPPMTAAAEVLVPVVAELAAAPPRVARDAGAGASAASASGLDVGAWIDRRGLPLTLLLVMLVGLGLNLTPCVYPLISVTVAYFGIHGAHRGGRVALLAALYVLGITLSFASVGVAAALSGGLFGAALQRPAVLAALAALMVLLALSSFGVYQLRPPVWLMRRLTRETHGGFGAFFMGLTMGVVAAPCVGPVVLGLLAFVGSRRDALLGFELFVALGLGMGLPYLGLALLAGSLRALPRSGDWLLWVERLFGFLLLGMAAYFVSPLLPAGARRWLYVGVAAAAGVYLGFVDRSGRGLVVFPALQRLFGVAALGLAIAGAVRPPAQSAIHWEPLTAAAVDAARTAGRPVLIDVMADWCIPCHEMEKTTYADPAVRDEAERFAMLLGDVTLEGEASEELMRRYDVKGVPTVVLFDAQGRETQRLVGYTGPEEMLDAMRRTR